MGQDIIVSVVVCSANVKLGSTLSRLIYQRTYSCGIYGSNFGVKTQFWKREAQPALHAQGKPHSPPIAGFTLSSTKLHMLTFEGIGIAPADAATISNLPLNPRLHVRICATSLPRDQPLAWSSTAAVLRYFLSVLLFPVSQACGSSRLHHLWVQTATNIRLRRNASWRSRDLKHD